MAGIERNLLEQLVNFLEVFKSASLELEATQTLHLPLPWYYKMKQHCIVNQTDCAEVCTVKCKASELLEKSFCWNHCTILQLFSTQE
jgi:hypothetical protein